MFCRKCGAENPDDSTFCQSCGTRFSQTSTTAPTVAPAAPSFDEERMLRDALAGRYEVLRKLGGGGMANVYYAREITLDRFVAIKVLPPAYRSNEDFVARFKREAKITAQFEHPNIITIHTIGIEPGLLYFVMNYLPGGTLADRLKEQGALDILAMIRWGRDICKALAYAHARGVIHRDLKPENVMLDSSKNAVVTDFGIAFAAEGTRMTREGTAIGTASYMSPEQAAGKAIDSRSDIYSLGVLLYQMATGVLPFQSDNPASLMYQHVHEIPEPPDVKNASVPPWLRDVILRCLMKKPEDRFQTAGDVLTSLTEGYKSFVAAIDSQHGSPPDASLTVQLASAPSKAKEPAPIKKPEKEKKRAPSLPPIATPPAQTVVIPPADPGKQAASGSAPVPVVSPAHRTTKKPPFKLIVPAVVVLAAIGLATYLLPRLAKKPATPASSSWEWVIEPRFSWAQTFSEAGLARVMVDDRYGFIGRDGAFVVEPRYDDAWPFDGPFTAVKENGKWGFIDTSGRVLTEPQFEDARGCQEGFAPFRSTQLWGFMDNTGTLVVKPLFDDVGMFREGLAPVFRGGRWGYIDTTGKMVVRPVYEDAEQACEGFAPVRTGSAWGYLNMNGEIVIEPRFEWAGPFSEGHALIREGGQWGYIDTAGNTVIAPVYDEGAAFAEGFARVLRNSRWGFIRPDGSYLMEPQFDDAVDFYDGMAPVNRTGLWGYVDSTGVTVIPHRFEDARAFEEGYAAVKSGGLWGFIDTTGEYYIEPRFNNAYSFTLGIAAVEVDGLWGYIRSGK